MAPSCDFHTATLYQRQTRECQGSRVRRKFRIQTCRYELIQSGGRSKRTVSSVSASAAVLSVRQRRMRGKRTAMPDLWRFERFRPSKASSKTSSGLTVRTGPNFSSMLCAHEGVDAADLGVGQARVRLGDRHQRAGARVPDAERVVGVQAGALAAAALGEQLARRRSCAARIFHFHQSPRRRPTP